MEKNGYTSREKEIWVWEYYCCFPKKVEVLGKFCWSGIRPKDQLRSLRADKHVGYLDAALGEEDKTSNATYNGYMKAARYFFKYLIEELGLPMKNSFQNVALVNGASKFGSRATQRVMLLKKILISVNLNSQHDGGR